MTDTVFTPEQQQIAAEVEQREAATRFADEHRGTLIVDAVSAVFVGLCEKLLCERVVDHCPRPTTTLDEDVTLAFWGQKQTNDLEKPLQTVEFVFPLGSTLTRHAERQSRTFVLMDPSSQRSLIVWRRPRDKQYVLVRATDRSTPTGRRARPGKPRGYGPNRSVES
jgi:hypothetical protein